MLAEVFEFDAEDESGQMACKARFETGASLNHEHVNALYHVLGAHWVVLGDKLADKPVQEQQDKLAGVMRRMADWYEAYLKWEDETYGDE